MGMMTLTRTDTLDITSDIIQAVAEKMFDSYDSMDEIERDEIIDSILYHAIIENEVEVTDVDLWRKTLSTGSFNYLVDEFWNAYHEYAQICLSESVAERKKHDKML